MKWMLLRCERTRPFGPAGRAAGEEDDEGVVLVDGPVGQCAPAPVASRSAKSSSKPTVGHAVRSAPSRSLQPSPVTEEDLGPVSSNAVGHLRRPSTIR